MNTNNIPLTNSKNAPLASEVQYDGHRSYTNANQIIDIAVNECKTNNRKGITYMTLLEKGIAKSKKQAQGILKHHRTQGTLFTIADKRPQVYYPSCLKSDILKKLLQKNTPIDHIGVTTLPNPLSTPSSPFGALESKHPSLNALIIWQIIHWKATSFHYFLKLLC